MVPCDPPQITKQLKTMLNRKYRLFENYKKHGYKDDDKIASPELPPKKTQDKTMRYKDTRTSKTDRNQTT